MPGRTIVKPPQVEEETPAEEERELRTGELSHSEYSSWLGSALVLASLGTLALIVIPRTKMLNHLSDLFIALAIALTLWSSAKFFLIRPKAHHWSEWILLIIILACVAAFVWLIIVI